MKKPKFFMALVGIVVIFFVLGFWNIKGEARDTQSSHYFTNKTDSDPSNNKIETPQSSPNQKTSSSFSTQQSVNVSVTVVSTASSDGISNVPIKIEQEDKLSSIVPL